MGMYRTITSLGVILGINLAVRVFDISVNGAGLILGNHMVESAASFAIVSLLLDLNLLKLDSVKNFQYYIKIGFIAFFAGIIFVAASFSALFVFSGFMEVVGAWFRIAPQVIFLISLPTLFIANKLSQKNKILGIENTGKRGLLNIFVISTAYSVGMIYLLNKYNFLMLG